MNNNTIIDNIIKVLPTVLKEQSQLAPFQLMALLGSEMELSEVNKDWINAKPNDITKKAFPLENMNFSLSDKLAVKTGAYLRSSDPRNKESLSKVTLNQNGLSIEFGTKLRRLHETGGFIKSKGKMQYWFFYQYFKTKNKFFKIVGASIMKKGGVNVKKRPHFNPAIEKFKNNATLWLNDIMNKILKKANEL